MPEPTDRELVMTLLAENDGLRERIAELEEQNKILEALKQVANLFRQTQFILSKRGGKSDE